MIEVEAALLALDGAISSAAALRAFTEGENDPVYQGLFGVLASAETARRIMVEIALQGAESPEVDGECQHPPDTVTVTPTRAGAIRFCQLCNEQIDEKGQVVGNVS